MQLELTQDEYDCLVKIIKDRVAYNVHVTYMLPDFDDPNYVFTLEDYLEAKAALNILERVK